MLKTKLLIVLLALCSLVNAGEFCRNNHISSTFFKSSNLEELIIFGSFKENNNLTNVKHKKILKFDEFEFLTENSPISPILNICSTFKKLNVQQPSIGTFSITSIMELIFDPSPDSTFTFSLKNGQDGSYIASETRELPSIGGDFIFLFQFDGINLNTIEIIEFEISSNIPITIPVVGQDSFHFPLQIRIDRQ